MNSRRIGNRFGSVIQVLKAPTNRYDATVDDGRRKAPTSRLNSEDKALCKTGRKKLTSSTRDLRRNFPDAAWAIRKHLDFNATFAFQARTGDDGLDTAIEQFVAWRSRAANFDLAARHGLSRFIRIAEAARTVDGDVFLLKLADGRLQAIEGDRVQTAGRGLPPRLKVENFTHGIRTSRGGRAMSYCVCKRSKRGGQMEFDRLFPAKWIIPHGYYDRFDQVRGITPLSSAINSFRDLYEARTYALAKAKVAQLFGMTIFRDAAESIGNITSPDADGDGEADAGGYEVDFEKGPVLLDLDPGDRAEFLENKTPSAEFREFDRVIVAAALKSLDIPYSFYDESHTNFFGSKGALQQYLHSAKIKRGDVREVLNAWTRWQLAREISLGKLKLPAGMTFDDLSWEWIAAGLPWWKPLEEVKADIAAIGAGLTSTPRACKARGEDAYEIAAEEAKYQIRLAALRTEVEGAGGHLGPAVKKPATDNDDDKNTLSEALSREMTGEKANV